MIIVFGILLAIVAFTTVVIIHELGHFLVARALGVQVEEFGVGLPPRVAHIGTDRHGTAYTINALPIGGFVRLRGESTVPEGELATGSLESKPVWVRMAVMLGGVAFNFLFAALVFGVLFWVGVSPLGINSHSALGVETRLVPTLSSAVAQGVVQVDGIDMQILSGSTAERAGLRSSDTLITIENTKITSPQDAVARIRAVATSGAKTVQVGVLREGKPLTIMVPFAAQKIGAAIGYKNLTVNKNFTYRLSLSQVMMAGAVETWQQIKLSFVLIGWLGKSLIAPAEPQDRAEAAASVSGPIGLGHLFVQLAQDGAGIVFILAVMALLSVNLGVFNLLPLPALDGWRFALLAVRSVVEWIIPTARTSGAWAHYENVVHLAGFSLLIILAIIVAYGDIVRILSYQ